MAKYSRPQVKVGDVVLVVLRGRTREGAVLIQPHGERVVQEITSDGLPVLSWHEGLPGHRAPMDYATDAMEGCFGWLETEWSVPYDDQIPGPVAGLAGNDEAVQQHDLRRCQYLAQTAREMCKSLYNGLPARSDAMRAYTRALDGIDALQGVAEKVG